MVPVVYDSVDHLLSTREGLEVELATLLAEAQAGRLGLLKRLDQVALPSTFYLVYQGMDDSGLMADISTLYSTLYPPLASLPSLLPPPPHPGQNGPTTMSQLSDFERPSQMSTGQLVNLTHVSYPPTRYQGWVSQRSVWASYPPTSAGTRSASSSAA